MIKVSVLYPYGEGKKFDLDYYCNNHIPMVKGKLGAACTKAGVESGMSDGGGGKPAFICVGYLCFDSLDAFQDAFGPHADKIMGDIPNFTDIQPEILICHVEV